MPHLFALCKDLVRSLRQWSHSFSCNVSGITPPEKLEVQRHLVIKTGFLKLWMESNLIGTIYNLNSKIFSCTTIITMLNLLCILFLTSKTNKWFLYLFVLYCLLPFYYIPEQKDPPWSLAHISCAQVMWQLHFAHLWQQHYLLCHKCIRRQCWRSSNRVGMEVTRKLWSAEQKWEKNVLNCEKCAYPCLLNHIILW